MAASVPLASTTLVSPAAAVTLPAAHDVVAAGVAAIVKPEGNASVRATPLSATAPGAVFGIVIVRTDVPPAGIVAGANASLVVIAASWTVRLAVAGAELETPSAVLNALGAIVFAYVAATVPVTSTLIVQLAFAASVPLANIRFVPPAVAVAVPEGHVVAAFGVAAIVTPGGNVSVNAIADSETAPGAVFGMEIVSVDMPPAGIVAGENASLNAMAFRLIARFAVAAAEFDAPSIVVSAPGAIVLVYVAAAVPVTSIEIVQVAFAASVPFVSLTLWPAVMTSDPPVHVVDAFGVAATVTPDGNTSLSATPESATAPTAVFAIVIVRVDVPPAVVAAGENALLSVIAAS